MSGCAGFDGQTCCVALAGAALPEAAPAEAAEEAPAEAAPAPPSEANDRSASGTTSLTAALACSRLTSAAEIVAEIALTMWNPRTFLACSWLSSDMMPACALLAALTREFMVEPEAGRVASWFLNTMIERWFASADSWATWAALSVDGVPEKTWTGYVPAEAGLLTASARSVAPA